MRNVGTELFYGEGQVGANLELGGDLRGSEKEGIKWELIDM